MRLKNRPVKENTAALLPMQVAALRRSELHPGFHRCESIQFSANIGHPAGDHHPAGTSDRHP
ncbi:MAG: hypothetical protein HGA21_01135 [Burkholderiaceae bacterium]|nr:hypothetical protein [Burkholderiaceae bacterium]